MKRRVFPLSLPASDPASAVILAWLEQLPSGVDVSPLMRQALALGLTLGPALERIAVQLEALEMRSGPVVEAGREMLPWSQRCSISITWRRLYDRGLAHRVAANVGKKDAVCDNNNPRQGCVTHRVFLCPVYGVEMRSEPVIHLMECSLL